MRPPPPAGARVGLENAEREDSGRGLTWFYLDVEGGYQYVGLETFDIDESNLTAGFIKNEANGGFIGAGLGLRLVFLTVGPHFRIGFFDSWQMYSAGGRVGFRFPLGRVEPFFGLGGGYSALGSVSGFIEGADDAVDIRGFHARLDGGLDFFPTNWLSLGGGASVEFLGLSRPGVSLDQLNAAPSNDLEQAQQQALAAEGSGYGTSVAISGRIGLHF